MYLEHFGLREYPFGITPNTEYFFRSNSSQEAFNTLIIAVKTGEGFIKITGDVGTGKTLLCRQLISALGSEFITAYLPNPSLSPQDFLLELSYELGVQKNLESQTPLRSLTDWLLMISNQGKQVVICIDESQSMPIETLESLRLLTNLETEKRKLIQVIIFGQPEIDKKLDHPSIRQLKQRITSYYHLQTLDSYEVDRYIQHRLKIAGSKNVKLFSKPALSLLKFGTKRLPRLLNIVAHKSLLSAYGKGKRNVCFTDVVAALSDTPSTNFPNIL